MDRNKRFDCPQCNFMFSQKYLLDKHMKSHVKFQGINLDNTTSAEIELKEPSEFKKIDVFKLSCSLCNFSTSRKSSLTNHIRRHNSGKPFTCKECGKGYTAESYLNAHLVNCHEQDKDIQPETEPFACTECDFKCSSISGLQEHRGEHILTILFYCQLCSAECIGESALKAHMAAHTEKETLTLSAELNYPNKKSNKHNLNTKYTNDNVLPVKSNSHTCTDCGNNFLSHQRLKWHLITHRNEKYYDCLDCEYKTIYERSLKIHRKQHVCNNLLACPECDFKTKIESILLNHINNHKENRLKLKKFRNCSTNSEVSLKCFHCSASYASLKQLTEHMKNHANHDATEKIKDQAKSCLAKHRKPSDITKQKTKIEATKEVLRPGKNTRVTLACEIKECKETFTSQRNFRKHMISHKLENMHKCNVCGYKCFSMYILKKHENNHRSHNCTECDFRCSSLKELKVHKEVHKDQIDVSEFSKNQPKDLKKGNKKVGEISCDKCKSLFSTNVVLKRHHRACEKSNLFKCNLCDYENAQSYNLVIHKEKHHGQARLKCEMCSFKTLIAKKLESHKLIHNVMTKKSSKAVKSDTKSSKNRVPSVNMTCVDKLHTNRTKKPDTKSSENLISSVNMARSARVDKLHTNRTKKPDTKSSENLISSVNMARPARVDKIHTNMTKKSDIKLSKNRISSVNMTGGDKIHINMTKKSDIKSSKNRISSVNMAGGDKIHTNMSKKSIRVMKSKSKASGKDHNSLSKTMPNINGKITCSECNFTFVTKSGLYKHIKTHYGENTFSCTKCPYKTNYSYNLKLHLEIHRFSRLLCLVCDYKCEKLIDLNNHMIEKHNLVHKTNTNMADHVVKEEIEISN